MGAGEGKRDRAGRGPLGRGREGQGQRRHGASTVCLPHFLLTATDRLSTVRPIMRNRLHRLIVGLAALAAATGLAPADEPGAPPLPQEGILLLRTGEVLGGRISRVGEMYYVALPSAGRPEEWAGGEIRVKAAEVEFCCRDLEDGYRRKRAAIGAADAEGHVRLAQWCLRHDLLAHAGRELGDALQADPSHPMIGLLQRKLKLAVEPHSRPRPTRPLDPAAAPEDLDRLVRDMPPGSVETFTQTIQPLLLNHCGTAACHGPGAESKFRLLRMPPGRPASRRFTQRNLHAVLGWVDRANPAASPLLTAPAGPHGTADKAIFGPGQDGQYRRLADWVSRLSSRPKPDVPETVRPAQKPPDRAVPAEPEGPSSPSPKASHAAGRPSEADSSPPARKLPASPSPVQRGAPLPVFIPVDPFDPEIFNRRFFSRS